MFKKIYYRTVAVYAIVLAILFGAAIIYSSCQGSYSITEEEVYQIWEDLVREQDRDVQPRIQYNEFKKAIREFEALPNEK